MTPSTAARPRLMTGPFLGEALGLVSLSLYAGVAVGPSIGELVLGQDRFALAWVAAAALAVGTRAVMPWAPDRFGGRGSWRG